MVSTHSAANGALSLQYRTFGGGPLDVLLVHGWMVSGAVFDELIECMGAHGLAGVRLIVPDLRGSGGSGQPTDGYGLDRYVSDVLAVADAAGSREFVIVGHSMGGQLALWIAAQQPERVLGAVLLCPVPPQGMTLPPEAQQLFRGSGGDRGMQGTILGLACKQIPDATRERLLDLAQAVSAECVAQTFDAWSGGFGEPLGPIQAPVLVVATDDPFTPPAFLQEAVLAPLSRARLCVLPGPGHYPQNERPRETAAILTAFLTALAR